MHYIDIEIYVVYFDFIGWWNYVFDFGYQDIFVDKVKVLAESDAQKYDIRWREELHGKGCRGVGWNAGGLRGDVGLVSQRDLGIPERGAA